MEFLEVAENSAIEPRFNIVSTHDLLISSPELVSAKLLMDLLFVRQSGVSYFGNTMLMSALPTIVAQISYLVSMSTK